MPIALGNFVGTSNPASSQEAEIRRQTDALIAQMQAFMEAQIEQANQQRLADQANADRVFNAEREEAERQRAVLERQLADQKAAQAEANARLNSERAAETAAAEQRATDARNYATGRESLIEQVTGAVNGAYGGFDDSYFDQFMSSIVSASRPEIDRAYKDDRRSARLALADRANLNSSAGARALSDLARAHQNKIGAKTGEASDMATRLRAELETQKRSALSGVINSAFVGSDDLPMGADVQGALDSTAGRLSDYVRSVTEQVKQYVPAAGRSSLLAPTITAPKVNTSSLVGSLQGAV